MIVGGRGSGGSSGAALNLKEGGLYCSKCIGYALGHAHFQSSGNNLVNTVVYVSALGCSMLLLMIGVYLSSLLLFQLIVKNFSSQSDA